MTIEYSFYALLSFIPALLNVGIVVYILFFLPKGKTTDIFTLFVIALLFWQAQDTFVRLCDSGETARFWDRIFSTGWISFAPLAFHFICRFASLKIAYKRLFLLAVYSPFLILYLTHISNDHLVFEKQGHWGWIHRPDPDSPEALLRFLISAYVMVALTILFRYAYSMRNNPEKKKQAYLVALGIFIPASIGITTQVIFPLVLSIDEVPLTSAFLTVFSASTIVALKKYRMFNIAESVAVEKVFENLKKIVLILSPDQKLLYANSYTKELFGLTEKGISSFSIKGLFSLGASYEQFIKRVVDSCLRKESVKNHTTRLRTVHNQQMDVLLSAEPIINNKMVQGILLFGNDITDHVRALKELEESNDRYNLISKATNDMVWDWNLITGEVYRSKEGWRKIFQDVLETELGQAEDWHSKIHPDDLWKIRQFRHQLDSGAIGDTFEVECKVIKKDGSIAYVLDRGYVVRNESGHPVRLIGALQNITLRKQTEFKLRDEQGLRHKQITDAVITAQEDERQYIGTELHDNVNQILTSAALYLNLASSEKANKDTFIQQAERILNSGIHEIRKLSHSLIRPALHTRTLEEALDNLLDTAEQSGLYTICRGYQHFDEEGISDKLKLAIFRIIQEQTNNIIKYASAKHIRVQLLRSHKHIVLRVEDNGIGFDPQHKSNGVGLTNIKTRAALHNGQMKITSAPNKGCILEVSFPIEAAELVHFG